MPPVWRAWLARALEQGPAAHGWTEDQGWTLARVSVLIARRFHVRFSQPQLSRIQRQMGLSVQVPVLRATERARNRCGSGGRRPGRAWKEGEGAGCVAGVRGRVGPGALPAQGPHLVPYRSAAAGQRVGEGIGAGLGRRDGLREAR
ncbi:winged helix-turn-helix domain-containing protein [Streptomyces sp. E11-3]|uniref:helix-turn-helix domain-containing protein n=1 Tax=Streptomyces sp. E11-3 TaxID=3110112 RepID=UPI00397FA69F